MKHVYINKIWIIFFAILIASASTLYPQITMLEHVVKIIDELDAIMQNSPENIASPTCIDTIHELKNYTLSDISLTEQEREALLEKIAEFETPAYKRLKNKKYACLRANNLTVCQNTTLNNLTVNGSFDICGVSACSIAAGYALLSSATSADIPDTLVLRDGGSFAATTITLTGVLQLQGANGNTVSIGASDTTDNYTLLLPTSTGANGYVLTADGNNPSQLSWQPVSALVTSTINLFGDVTGPANNNTVASVCGVPACTLISTVTSGTPLDIPNTLVMRDGTGSFAATTIDFVGGNSNVVGIQAPAVVTSSYTFALPATGPTGVGQVLTSISASATQWAASVAAETIYVEKGGSDITGNGSFLAPYASLKRALVDANALATPTNPIQIVIGSGIFVEDNSSGPLTVNPATTGGLINIVGASQITTILTASVANQNFLALTSRTYLDTLEIIGATNAIGIVATGATNNSLFVNVRVLSCQQGFNLSGGPGTGYYLNGCSTNACGTGMVVNNARAIIYNHVFVGTTSIPTPMFAGFLATGANALVALESPLFYYCSTGVQTSQNASAQVTGGSFIGNIIGVQSDTGSNTIYKGLNFLMTSSVNMYIQDSGTIIQAAGCDINGLSLTNIPTGIGLQVINGAQIGISASNFTNLVDGIITGSPADASPAQVNAGSVSISNCTDKQIIQNDEAVINFIGGSFASDQIIINTAGKATFNSSDGSNDNATLIGQFKNVTQDIIIIGTSETTPPALTYQRDYNGSSGLIYIDETGDTATVVGVESITKDAQLSAVTNQNTQAASVQLYSGNIGTIPPSLLGASNVNILGWELKKTGTGTSLATTANLQANFMNNDLSISSTISKYTSFYVDGFNNVFNFPLVTTAFPPTNATTVLQWGQDVLPSTNLYRASTALLKTDANFAIGTLGASSSGFALTAASPSNIVQVSPTTATELGYVHGVTGPIQTQLDSKLPLSGGTLTGPLTLPDGTSSAPSLNFAGCSGTGLAAPGCVLTLINSGSPSLTINQSGNVVINQAASGTTLTITGGGALISGNLTIPSGTGIITTDAITINNPPVNPTDGTNKAYVDSVAVGLQVKGSCDLVDVTTTATSGFPIIDSVATSTGYRVLLTAETDGVLNGIWQINSGGYWQRPSDFPSGGSAVSAYTFITSGSIFAGSSWICTNTIGNATIDTNTLNWTEFSQPQNITAQNLGTGVGIFAQKVGNVLNFKSLDPDPSGNIVLSPVTSTDITIALSPNPSVSSLMASGAVTAGTLSDGAGTTITGGNVNAINVIATTTLRAGNGSAAFPSIDFVGSPFTGLSAQIPDTLVISTTGLGRLQFDSLGNITVQNNPQFPGTAGVVHNNAAGQLSSSLIVDADITAGTITDDKLATITTAGKVANSATTATIANTLNTIVLRDGTNGGFSAGTINAISLLANDGSAAVPSISFTSSSNAGLSVSSGNLTISSNGLPQITLNSAGNQIQFPSAPYTTAGILHTSALGVLSTSAVNLATEVSGILPIVNGGTNSNTALNNNKVMISSAGKIVESAVTTNQLNLLTTAASNDIINTLVLRDGTGSFSSTNITLTGNLTLQGQTGGTLIVNTSGLVTTTIGAWGDRLATFGSPTTVQWALPLAPAKESLFFDDFMGSASPFADTVWASATSNGGTITTVAPGTSNSTVGIVRLSTGATSNTTGHAVINKNSASVLFGGNRAYTYEARVAFPTISLANTRARIGWGDQTTNTDFTNGVYFEYNFTTGGNFWRIATENNGAITGPTTTTAAVAANTEYKLGIVIDTAGASANYYVNDVFVGNIASIPTAAGRNTGLVALVTKTATTTNNLAMDIDYIYQYMTRQ